MRPPERAFRKVYLQLEKLTRATCTVEAEGVGFEEMAWVDGRAAQVVKIDGKEITLQVFRGTEGLSTRSEVLFSGQSPTLAISEALGGRVFNAYGTPIDEGAQPAGEAQELSQATVNPVRRKQPFDFIETLLPGIDLNNTLVAGQKIPFFADSDQPYNLLMATVAMRSRADRIVLGGMGLPFDDYLMIRQMFESAGLNQKVVSFIHTQDDPALERLLIPDLTLSTAEYFATQHQEKVLVLLTDMTLYAEALAIVSNKMDQIPSKDSMPGSLYSDLARLYERAVQFPDGGSVTILAVTTLSQGDITHAIPDNTGYITEGQLYLRNDKLSKKIIVDPFRSLSRLKQLVIGKTTREDHSQVLQSSIRLYADAANALTKQENGFDLTAYDRRTISFAEAYAGRLLAIDSCLSLQDALDTVWSLLATYFSPEETGIKSELIKKFWPKADA